MDKIGKYEILEPIGKGAMGLVYKAQDPEIGRIVAIKTLKSMYMGEDVVGAEAMQRFRQESRSAGRLQHPNIVTIFEAGRGDDGSPYIVMSHIEGKSLDKLLLEKGALDPLEVVHYLAQIASAVDYAHRQNVVHRDIKPSNVLVDANATPHLLDFGVAKLGDTSLTPAGTVVGTPSYMSPEQIRGEQLDGRADIFSLSVVAYELLTKQRPFPGGDFTSVVTKIIHEAPIAICSIAPTLPRNLDNVFEQGLAKDRNDRFGTATELVQAIASEFGVPIDGFGIIGGFDPAKKWDPKSAKDNRSVVKPKEKRSSERAKPGAVQEGSQGSAENIQRVSDGKGARFATAMLLGIVVLVSIVALVSAIVPLSKRSENLTSDRVRAVDTPRESALSQLEAIDKSETSEGGKEKETVAVEPGESREDDQAEVDEAEVAEMQVRSEETPIVDVPVAPNLEGQLDTAHYVFPEVISAEQAATLSAEQLHQGLERLPEVSEIPPENALAIVVELGRRADPGLSKAFSKFLLHKDYAVRIAVLKQMRLSPYSETPEALDYASKLLDDSEYLVRGFAAKALLDIPDTRVEKLLEDRLSSESHPVVQQVLRDGLLRLEQSVKSR